jgi:O-glycosyl hydrolase
LWCPAAGVGAVLFLFFLSASAQNHALKLPDWNAPVGQLAQPFAVPPKVEKIDIWGRGKESPRFYSQEFLPAVFERTLALEYFTPGTGRLEWMFTGAQGGFTVGVTETNFQVTTRYYDSPAFNELKIKPARHPEITLATNTAEFTGQLKSVTVRMDDKLGLTILANCVAVLRQPCVLDVSRHQLLMSDPASSATGQMLSPAPQTVRVDVQPEKKFQTMIGFGGITSMVAFNEMDAAGKRAWWDWLCRYNLLVQREYPIGQRLNRAMDNWDNRAAAAPHYYGDNFPVGEISDFNYNRTIRKLGGQVWFEFWNTPTWAGKDSTQYAGLIVNYCQTAKAKAGAPPEIVGIQNERKPEDAEWFKRILTIRRALDAAGFADVKLHMNDASPLKEGLGWAKKISQAGEAWQAIDFSASHIYDFQNNFTQPDAMDAMMSDWKTTVAGKPFLSTELCVNEGKFQTHSYRVAFAMGQLYHKNLVLMDAAAICYCWLLIDTEQPSYGATRSLFVPDRTRGFAPVPSSNQLRVFGAYSRRIRAGMQRVAAESSAPDLLVSAFAGQDGAATLVLLNRSTAPMKVPINWPGIKFTEQEISDPYHENSVTPLPADLWELVVEPGSIVTWTDVPLGQAPENLE